MVDREAVSLIEKPQDLLTRKAAFNLSSWEII